MSRLHVYIRLESMLSSGLYISEVVVQGVRNASTRGAAARNMNGILPTWSSPLDAYSSWNAVHG